MTGKASERPAGAAAARDIPILRSVGDLADGRDAWICDIWGVLHDGLAPFAPAVAACQRFRAGGGSVVLLSNAPRPAASVITQLDTIGVARGAYDAVVTSGDLTRDMVRACRGRPLAHIGPERDAAIFEGIDVRWAGEDAAEVVVCSGLADDETETPVDYADRLAALARRGVPMICANPDIKVERGARLVWCAGGLAEAYAALGGDVTYAGKPHAPAYARVEAAIAQVRSGTVDRNRMLAIGDGVRTDIAGAAAAGIASLFIASALHAPGGLDAALLHRLFPPGGPRPLAAMAGLVW